MIKFIIGLIAKKSIVNGQTVFQPPKSGWRKRLFERLIVRSFEKEHRNIENFPINELDKTLLEVENFFREKNRVFQVDIYNGQENDLQIIHPIMITDKIKNERLTEFGFMVYITFYSSLDNNSERHKKFKALENYSDYYHFIHDEGVDCYALECGLETAKVIENSKLILTNVLGYPADTNYYFGVSDHGKVG